MVAWDIGLAFVIATVYAMLLLPLLGPRRVGIEQFVLFFVLLFVALWAGAVWLRPLGPHLYGVPWLALLVFGGLLALFVAVLAGSGPRAPRHLIAAPAGPLRHHVSTEDLPEEARALRAGSPESVVGETTFITAGLLFWVLIVVLLGLIFGNYALVGR